MDFQELTKKLAINNETNAGLSLGESFAQLTGNGKKNFISLHDEVVSIGGDKLNLQMHPGQISLMGGLFKFNGFPMAMIPSTIVKPTAMIKLDLTLIKNAISVATLVMDMASLYM